MALLIAAFLFRVVMQALQGWWPVAWLPPFDRWHSATVPYPVLQVSQLAIAAAQIAIVTAMVRGRYRPNRRLGVALFVVGAAYFAFMLIRLIGGLTVLRHVPWFQVILPTVFHLVLAGFLLVLADFHLRLARSGGSAV